MTETLTTYEQARQKNEKIREKEEMIALKGELETLRRADQLAQRYVKKLVTENEKLKKEIKTLKETE